MDAARRRVVADLVFAGSLAALAGATDVYGFDRLRGMFVSFMSGNTTLLGKAAGLGDWVRVGQIAAIAAAFVLGATLGAVVAERTGPRRTPAVLALVTAFLAAAAAWPSAEVASWLVAMGALNASMNQVGRANVSLTYVTGTLVKFAQGLGQRLAGRNEGWSWLLQLPMWLCLLAGGAAGAVLQAALGPAATWPLPAWAAALTLVSLLR